MKRRFFLQRIGLIALVPVIALVAAIGLIATVVVAVRRDRVVTGDIANGLAVIALVAAVVTAVGIARGVCRGAAVARITRVVAGDLSGGYIDRLIVCRAVALNGVVVQVVRPCRRSRQQCGTHQYPIDKHFHRRSPGKDV